jgi:hypothetical protein
VNEGGCISNWHIERQNGKALAASGTGLRAARRVEPRVVVKLRLHRISGRPQKKWEAESEATDWMHPLVALSLGKMSRGGRQQLDHFHPAFLAIAPTGLGVPRQHLEKHLAELSPPTPTVNPTMPWDCAMAVWTSSVLQ